MDYTTFLTYFTSTPNSEIEAHAGDTSSLFDMIPQAIDDVPFSTSIDDFYATMPPDWMVDAGPLMSQIQSDNCVDLGLSISMDFGELAVPDTVPHEPCKNNNFNLYPDCLQFLDSTAHIVFEDCSASPAIYHDTSYAGDSSSRSNSTAWEWNVQSHSNSHKLLEMNHMDTGMSNYDIPCSYVIQRQQELDTLSGSYDQYTSFQELSGYHHHQYTHFLQDIQHDDGAIPYPFPSELGAAPSSHPCVEESLHDSRRHSSSSIIPPALEPSLSPPSSSANTSSPSSSPVTQGNESPPSSRSGSPTTSIPQPKLPSEPPKKKRARSPKKVIPSSTIAPPKARGPRKPPGGRAPIRCQSWIDTYFPTKGFCKLCGKGPKTYRTDRALEHLASTHIVQAVKNLDIFDPECLEELPDHFIRTEAQFLFVRQYVDAFKCSLCPRETSLVFREENIKKHLDVVHFHDAKEARDRELKRVRALTQNRKEWYSPHDEFLYNFSLLQSS